MRRILHLIPMLNFGGASRAAIATAAACARASGDQHAIVSVRPSLGTMAADTRTRGVAVVDAPGHSELLESIREAEITVLHLWNSPELIELLESELPRTRFVVWPHVGGDSPPQVLAPEIFRRTGESVATSPRTAGTIRRALPSAAPEVIPPVGGWDRIEGVARSSRPGFNVGYLGTIAFTRMHPDFVGMSVAAEIDDARFILGGAGSAVAAVRRQAAELGAAERFELRGQLKHISTALTDFDVFGYPLRRSSSVSADLTIKEAMYAGLPPVVLRGTVVDEMVVDGETGIVAADESAYARALEGLAADPVERARLGAAAHSFAVEAWTPEQLVPRWLAAFERAQERPPMTGPLMDSPDPTLPKAVARFLRGLGGASRDFELSLHGPPIDAAAAEDRIATCDPLIAYEDGGLFDHRRRYADDPTLAFWTSLYLSRQGRRALAAGERATARRLGCDPALLARHDSPEVMA